MPEVPGHSYDVVLSSGVAAFLVEQRKPVQRSLIQLMRTMALHPAQSGDYAVKDSSGRPLQVQRIGKFAFTYWPDDAARELRILEIVAL